jgi:hypothetical protein
MTSVRLTGTLAAIALLAVALASLAAGCTGGSAPTDAPRSSSVPLPSAGSVPGSSAPAATAPADAVSAVGALGSPDRAVVRRAMTRALAGQLDLSRLAPPGTAFAVPRDTWQQVGDYARMSVVVTVPGQPPVDRLFYLVREEGRWRIAFSERH